MAKMIAKLAYDVQYELARLVSHGSIQYSKLSMRILTDGLPAISADRSTNATLASRILKLVSSEGTGNADALLENADSGE